MFDPTATLARINLWFALLLRLVPFANARFEPCLVRMERDLAAGIRATLAAAGIAAPDVSDTDLIAWFGKHRPGSDSTTSPGLGATQDRGLVSQRKTIDPGNGAAHALLQPINRNTCASRAACSSAWPRPPP